MTNNPHVWLTNTLLNKRWSRSKLIGVAITLASVIDPKELRKLLQEELGMEKQAALDPGAPGADTHARHSG